MIHTAVYLILIFLWCAKESRSYELYLEILATINGTHLVVGTSMFIVISRPHFKTKTYGYWLFENEAWKKRGFSNFYCTFPNYTASFYCVFLLKISYNYWWNNLCLTIFRCIHLFDVRFRYDIGKYVNESWYGNGHLMSLTVNILFLWIRDMNKDFLFRWGFCVFQTNFNRLGNISLDFVCGDYQIHNF